MQRPALIRAVYAELRASLGAEAPGGDLLRLANLIVLAMAEAAEQDDLDEESASRAFITLPVDDAMSDGGWRILAHEKGLGPLEDIGRNSGISLRLILNRILGPEWRHPELTRLP